jgi:hypothetical protein
MLKKLDDHKISRNVAMGYRSANLVGTADWYAIVACVPIVVDFSTGSGQWAEAVEVSQFTGRNLGGRLASGARSTGNPKF